MLKYGDTVGIVGCSDGQNLSNKDKILELQDTLNSIGISVIYSNKLYKEFSVFNGSPKDKAEELMNMFLNKEVKAIFDISGGDLANSVLDYLDYDKIKENYKPFFGYSDVTVVTNAIYEKTKEKTYLYQIRNLINYSKTEQILNFKNTLIGNGSSLYDFNYEWIQGESMNGTVVGGNIRCFLKLAGTEYMMSFENKILLLEGFSGGVSKMYTYLNQYKQLKVFENINGIILGTFTEMEREKYSPDIIEMVREIAGTDIPIIKTNEIGHGSDSKCVIIGEKMSFKR